MSSGRMRYYGIVGLLLLWVVFSNAQMEPLTREVEDQVPLKRFEWFYKQRAYPNEKLEPGYLLRALQELRLAQMKQGATPNSIFTWTSAGPTPGAYGNYGNVSGRMTGIAVDPTNANIIYIAAADGGVWKTTNGGGSWTPKTDYVGTLASGSIAIDPSNPLILYYGTGEPYYSGDAYGGIGVLKSTDGGESWSSSGLSNQARIPSLAIDPNNTSVIFAGTWSGLYRSSDAGATWTRVISSAYAYDVVVDPSNSLFVYAGMGDNTANAGIWKSTDGGLTFGKLSGGLPASGAIQRVRLGICENSPSVLYTLMSSTSPSGGFAGAYKTTDGGANWTDANGGGYLDAIFGSAGGAGQGWYDIAVAVSPTDPNLVFMSGIDTWRSVNGGSSWTNVTTGYSGGTVHVDHHELYFAGSTLFLLTDGGIWRTTNNGSAWTNLNSNISAIQFYDITTDYLLPERAMGGTQDNGSQRTLGPMTWASILGGDGGMSVIDYTNSSIIYAESQNGNRYRSTNSGGSWSSINNGIGNGPWVTPLIMHPSINTKLYSSAFSTAYYVYKTTNSGGNWSQTSASSPFGSNEVTTIAYHPIRNILYATANNRIYKSLDDGSSWSTMLTASAYITDVEFDLSDPFVVYITLSGTGTTHIQKSTNEGISWTSVTGDLPRIPTNCLKVQPWNNNRLYAGTDLGIFISTNGGTNWLKENTFPDVAVVDMEITGDNYLLVGTHGRGAWKASLATTIAGNVFDDADGDSSTAGDRTPSAGWLVKLLSGITVVDSQLTTGSGQYSFTSLPDGSYEVVLSPLSGHIGFEALPGMGGVAQSKISNTQLHVDILNSQTSENNDFLTYQMPVISGAVFEDVNGNGLLDSGEPVVAGRPIYLEGPVSDTAISGLDGLYAFVDLPIGFYTVAESVAAGWVVTTPTGGSFADTLTSGEDITLNFGNFQIGTLSGLVFRDSDQDGSLDPAEPLLAGWPVLRTGLTTAAETTWTLGDGTFTFANVGPDAYTIQAVRPSSGWGQTRPALGAPYTIAMTSGAETTGLEFGYFPLDSIRYRSATLASWAFAVDGKGKYKSVKRKPDKVDFEFVLAVPAQGSIGASLALDFSMDAAGVVTTDSGADTVGTFSGKKIVLAFSPPLDSGTLVTIRGRGVKGKLMKTKFAWGTNKKLLVSQYMMNAPRLPMPNLHNLGEEEFTLPGGLAPTGLRIGFGAAHAVQHMKYKDVLKSLNKKGATHTGTPRCLDVFTSNGKPIAKLQKYLPMDKQNNTLFGELVALKLNMKASELGGMTMGFGELIYTDSGATPLHGLTVATIAGFADSFMTTCDSVTDGITAREFFDALHAINQAFDGPIDTVQFAQRTILAPVRYLAEVSYLQPNAYAPAPSPMPRYTVSDMVPETFELSQNYPNPFNPVTTIEVTLPEEAITTIVVYDVLGRVVATIADREVVDEGTSEFTFDGGGLASGVYFYRVVAQRIDDGVQMFVDTKKMMLTK